jgi:tight adherence protein B
MSRRARLLFSIAGAALAAATLTAPAPAANGLKITEGAGAHFPDRAYILDLPRGMLLTPSRIHVFENGRQVKNPSLVAAGSAAARQLGVVLLIDASKSMRGRPIAGALSAARTFLLRRTPNEQVSVVMFNDTTSVVLSLTDDPEKIQEALSSRPQLALGTHIYDGVAAALKVLGDANVPSGSIILLSDGRDTGSEATASKVAAAARAAHVRIFAVGLRSRSFAPAPLRELARDAGGHYSEASSSRDLQRIYDDLGAQLAGEYLLHYRSAEGGNRRVRVAVTVDGVPGSVATGYRTPSLPLKRTSPFHFPVLTKFWRSGVSLVFVSLTIAILVGLALLTLVRTPAPTLRRRMAQFVSMVVPGEGKRPSMLTGRVVEGTERSLARTQWWSRFKEELELAQIKMPATHVVLWTFIATVLLTWLLAIISGSALIALFGLGVPFGVRGYLKRKLARLRDAFAEQLPDNLQVLASALRAGHSLVGALSVVVDDAPEPASTEFRRVVADEQLGVPLEDALDAAARRMDNRDLEQVALVAALQRQTGGNSAEVLDRVTETIRDRAELRRLVNTLTAQGRMSRWIVSFLPVVLLLAITAVNPHYIEPLYARSAGRALLAVATVMVVAGSLVIKRIVNIRV